MRHKPYAKPELAAWPYHIDDPTLYRDNWNACFANPALPLCVELGCGKGGFISAISSVESTHNYLGIDIKSEMLVVAKRTIERQYKMLDKPLSNILLTSWNIEKITDILSYNDDIDRIYINFCNPWYKSGHAKHRLTHPRQLVQYRNILRPNGDIYFKTDDDILFNDSLRYFSLAGFEVIWHTRDLHTSEPDWNVRTEHENMFAAQGIAIKSCILRMTNSVNLNIDSLMHSRSL